jgi:hypothetical protein
MSLIGDYITLFFPWQTEYTHSKETKSMDASGKRHFITNYNGRWRVVRVSSHLISKNCVSCWCLFQSRVTLRLALYRQSVCIGDNPMRLRTSNFIFQLNTCGYSPYVTSSPTRDWVSFTIAAGPRQRSHSQVRVPRDSWPHFTVSDSWFPQHGGSGLSIYVPTVTGWPSYTPWHWVPFSSQGYAGCIRPRLHTGFDASSSSI